MKKLITINTLAALALSACGPQTAEPADVCDPAEEVAALFGANAEVADGSATFAEDGDSTRVTLDASLGGIVSAAQSSYVYLDLDAPGIVEVSDADALTNADWELAFNRSIIRVNSGDSGPGGVTVARVDDTSWEDAMPATSAPWTEDDVIDDECNQNTFFEGFLQTAFGQWYDYDFESHTPSVIDGTIFFVHDADTDTTRKLQIETYSEGVYGIRWE